MERFEKIAFRLILRRNPDPFALLANYGSFGRDAVEDVTAAVRSVTLNELSLVTGVVIIGSVTRLRGVTARRCRCCRRCRAIARRYVAAGDRVVTGGSVIGKRIRCAVGRIDRGTRLKIRAGCSVVREVRGIVRRRSRAVSRRDHRPGRSIVANSVRVGVGGGRRRRRVRVR